MIARLVDAPNVALLTELDYVLSRPFYRHAAPNGACFARGRRCYRHVAPNGACACGYLRDCRSIIAVIRVELACVREVFQTAGVANTYTQIYIQVVFAVQGRQNLIVRERKGELHKYITGIVTRQGQKAKS